MNVNWQNLISTIQNGQIAFNNSGIGELIDDGKTSINDYPSSEYAEGALYDFKNKPDIFSFGSSQWGKSDVLKE